MLVGYDIFYTKPGSTDEMYCLVCNTMCNVKRNTYGPANFASAVARRYDYYDVFICPHAEEEWHEQALQLVLAIEEMPSKRVAALMRQDLEDLLAENGIE